MSFRCVIYTRVSTAEQGENTSLESQFAACLSRLHTEGAQLVQHFSDVQSGADYQSRLGLQKALDEIESQNANLVIVYDMSRLSRDSEHQQAIRKRIERAGARLIFCTQQFDATPEGSLMFGVTGSFAEYERLKIRERTMRGRRARAESGRQPCSAMSPFGYNVVTKEQIMRGEYTIEQLGTYQEVENQAQWVKPLFEKFVSTAAYNALAQWLTGEKVTTPRGAAAWSAPTIRGILTNPVYKGAPEFGEHKRLNDESRLARGVGKSYLVKTDKSERLTLNAPALVSEELWEAAQKRVAEIANGRRSFKERRYLLSGLLRCPDCGRSMIGRYQGGNSFYAAKKLQAKGIDVTPTAVYKCRSKWEKNETPCAGVSYNIEATDAALIKQVTETLANSRQLEQALRRQLQESTPKKHTDKSQLPKLKKQLTELEKFQSATAEAQIRAIVEREDTTPYERKMREFSEHKRKIEVEILEIENGQKSICRATVSAQAKSLRTAMAELSAFFTDSALPMPERFEALSLLIEYIVPKNEQELQGNENNGDNEDDKIKSKRGRPSTIISPKTFIIHWRLGSRLETKK